MISSTSRVATVRQVEQEQVHATGRSSAELLSLLLGAGSLGE
jgi:hypothetical protein